MVKLKPILRKYLAKGDNLEIFLDVLNKIEKSGESSIDIDNYVFFNLPIEIEIYFFLKDIYGLAIIGVYNFTACYKCFSIKNLGLTFNEHMHYLVPFQMKLYFNYKKIMDLQKCRWMDIENIFTDKKAFVIRKRKENLKNYSKIILIIALNYFVIFLEKLKLI